VGSWKNVSGACALAMFAAMTPVGGGAWAQSVAADGVTVKIAGRSLRCGQTPIVMDSDIPTEGLSVPGEALYLNPLLMQRLPQTVRLFIFKHECAHEMTGPDELGADCIAAKSGKREGWLKPPDIDAVCRSFAGPATDTHPSGSTRCANVRRCYGGAQVASVNSGGNTASRTSSWTSPATPDQGAENASDSMADEKTND
jgi:hypothetical protein